MNKNHDVNDNQASPRITINTQYNKRLSFVNPNAPLNLGPLATPPAMELNLDLAAKIIQEGSYEVSMQIKAKAMNGDNILFTVELDYAGLFTLENIPEEQKEFILLVHCPSIIFPFARRIVADATRDGGFHPLMIDPVDFATLYAHKKQQEGKSDEGGDSTPNLTGMPNYN